MLKVYLRTNSVGEYDSVVCYLVEFNPKGQEGWKETLGSVPEPVALLHRPHVVQPLRVPVRIIDRVEVYEID